MERTSKKNFIIDVLYIVLVFALIITVSFVVFKFLFPFVVGVVVALCVQMPASKLAQRTRLSKGISAAVLSLVLYVLITLLACFLVYRIILSSVGFIDYLPVFFENTGEKLIQIGEKYSNIFERVPEEMRLWLKTLTGETVQNVLSYISRQITDTISLLVKKMPLFLISGIVTLVASCYIAKDFDSLKRFVKSVIGNKYWSSTVKIKKILAGSVFKMVKGYFFLSAITCAQLYIGFLFLKVGKPFTVALFISAVDLLPVLGTGTVMIPWAFITALIGNYTAGIGLGILYIITVIVRNFLEPKIIGKQLGVNALFTLVAMFLGLKVLGFWGLILFPIILIVTVQYYREEVE